jgi:hypothetical protein
MISTQERLAMLQFELTTLRAQLAEIAGVADYDRQRTRLFRELVYCRATYGALLRKHSRQPAYALGQHAVNQLDNPSTTETSTYLLLQEC